MLEATISMSNFVFLTKRLRRICLILRNTKIVQVTTKMRAICGDLYACICDRSQHNPLKYGIRNQISKYINSHPKDDFGFDLNT
jgi:hypothetical protein